MKKLLLATFVALLMAGCGEGSKKPTEDSPESNQSPAAPPIVVNWNQLQDRNGVYYLPNESKPFTGVAVRKYKSGQKEETTFKDGKQHGSVTGWYPNGQKRDERTWKDDKRWSATVWKPNGEKCPDTNIVDGNGIWCMYHNNGQKSHESTWKDGKKISVKGWYTSGKRK